MCFLLLFSTRKTPFVFVTCACTCVLSGEHIGTRVCVSPGVLGIYHSIGRRINNMLIGLNNRMLYYLNNNYFNIAKCQL